MDAVTRRKLEELAVERLAATAEDREQSGPSSSRTNGSICLRYWPLSRGGRRDFGRHMTGLDLPRSSERRGSFETGDSSRVTRTVAPMATCAPLQSTRRLESEDAVMISIVAVVAGAPRSVALPHSLSMAAGIQRIRQFWRAFSGAATGPQLLWQRKARLATKRDLSEVALVTAAAPAIIRFILR